MSSTLVYQEFSHSQTQSSSSLCLKLNNPPKDTAKCMWTAIESLSGYPKQETEKEYVHPSAKRPSMSERSLEMCTESLCNETGVFFTDSYLTFSTTSTTTTAATAIATATTTITSSNNNNKKPRRENNSNYSFPPPLTTMRGSNSLQVRPYREDGRLVIEAIPSPLSHGPCLKAERSDGRLRMSLVRQIEEVEEEEIEVAIAEGNFGNKCNNIDDVEEKEEVGSELGGVKLTKEDNNYQTESQFLTTFADSNVTILPTKLPEDNKMNGITKVEELGGKMGRGEHNELSQRGKMGNNTNCRCKEGGRGNMNMRRLNNWEPFWVAT